MKQLRRLQEIAEPIDGRLLDVDEHLLPRGRGLVYIVEGEAVVFEDLIREEMHSLGEVFVENEAENVVAKFIGPHLSTQGIGDFPELALQDLLVVFGHG